MCAASMDVMDAACTDNGNKLFMSLYIYLFRRKTYSILVEAH